MLSLEWPHQKTNSNSLALSSISKKVGTRCRSLLRGFLGRMKFTLHATHQTPHGASRLVQAMSAWLVKSLRAPSRHSRDARVYGHTTTAMPKLTTPPPVLVHALAFVSCRGCRSHAFLWEQANAAQFGGVGYRPLPNLPDGTIDLGAVRSALCRVFFLSTVDGVLLLQSIN